MVAARGLLAAAAADPAEELGEPWPPSSSRGSGGGRRVTWPNRRPSISPGEEANRSMMEARAGPEMEILEKSGWPSPSGMAAAAAMAIGSGRQTTVGAIEAMAWLETEAQNSLPTQNTGRRCVFVVQSIFLSVLVVLLEKRRVLCVFGSVLLLPALITGFLIG